MLADRHAAKLSFHNDCQEPIGIDRLVSYFTSTYLLMSETQHITMHYYYTNLKNTKVGNEILSRSLKFNMPGS